MASTPTFQRDKRAVEIEHPNRGKTASKVTRAIVFLLLIASIVLLGVISFGGWDKFAGARPLLPIWMGVYLLMAFYVLRWNRGVLPMASALAVLLGIFAAIAAPEWLVRDNPGYATTSLSASVLGVLTFIVIPVQVLLITFAMRGFQQEWNVEVEVPAQRAGGAGSAGGGSATPATA